jgi:hypothetical protein
MKINTLHFCRTGLFSVALLATIAAPAIRAADHKPARYHDNDHNDDHEWNKQEDKAYRMWAKENHRKYNAFTKLKDDDRQSYWRWRHDHSDSVLKINIR